MNRRFYLASLLLVVVGTPIGCNVAPPGSAGTPELSPDEPGATETPELSNDALPDFSLPDVNANSTRYQETVSPRDYLGQISAWYFGQAT